MNHKIDFQYVFEQLGTIAQGTVLEQDVWIDVGNDLREGVFDHHQGGVDFRSSFEAIVYHPELLKSVFESVEASRQSLSEGKHPEVRFHLHVHPDIDGISGVYLIQRMLENNCDDAKKLLPEYVLKRLIEYVNRIDHGSDKSLANGNLYAYIMTSGFELKDPVERSRKTMDAGLKAFDLAVKALEKEAEGSEIPVQDERKEKKPIDLFEKPLEDYVDISRLEDYERIVKELESRIRQAYEKDKLSGNVVFKNITVWNRETGAAEPVKAAVWQNLPSGEDGYALARDIDECMLTIYPYNIRREGEEGHSRVVISLNPDLPNAGDYTLFPMAELLEQYEQIEENRRFESTGIYERNHAKARAEEGYLSQLPFSVTDDPWFITEEGDLLDAPRCLSRLSYETILAIADRNISPSLALDINCVSFIYSSSENETGQKTDKTHSKKGGLNPEPVLKETYTTVRYGELYEKTRKAVSGISFSTSEIHRLYVIKADSSLLSQTNVFLKYFCLNMVGKADSPIGDDNIMYLDYQTCLYADPAVTILITTNRNSEYLKKLLGNNLAASPLCQDIQKMLQHHQTLRELGKSLSVKIETIESDTDKINDFNTRLVNLNTAMEEDDFMTGPLEQEVHAFIKGIFDLDRLSQSVFSSSELVISRAQEEEVRKEKERDERMQFGLSLISVLAFFSALIDFYDYINTFTERTEDGWGTLLSNHPNLAAFTIILSVIIAGIGIFSIISAFKMGRKIWGKKRKKRS